MGSKSDDVGTRISSWAPVDNSSNRVCRSGVFEAIAGDTCALRAHFEALSMIMEHNIISCVRITYSMPEQHAHEPSDDVATSKAK